MGFEPPHAVRSLIWLCKDEGEKIRRDAFISQWGYVWRLKRESRGEALNVFGYWGSSKLRKIASDVRQRSTCKRPVFFHLIPIPSSKATLQNPYDPFPAYEMAKAVVDFAAGEDSVFKVGMCDVLRWREAKTAGHDGGERDLKALCDNLAAGRTTFEFVGRMISDNAYQHCFVLVDDVLTTVAHVKASAQVFLDASMTSPEFGLFAGRSISAYLMDELDYVYDPPAEVIEVL